MVNFLLGRLIRDQSYTLSKRHKIRGNSVLADRIRVCISFRGCIKDGETYMHGWRSFERGDECWTILCDIWRGGDSWRSSVVMVGAYLDGEGDHLSRSRILQGWASSAWRDARYALGWMRRRAWNLLSRERCKPPLGIHTYVVGGIKVLAFTSKPLLLVRCRWIFPPTEDLHWAGNLVWDISTKEQQVRWHLRPRSSHFCTSKVSLYTFWYPSAHESLEYT
jgi:hypothetical protein